MTAQRIPLTIPCLLALCLLAQGAGAQPPSDPPQRATANETTAGETAAGETAAGETAAGETAAGETAAGETAAGETAAGETTAGETTVATMPQPADDPNLLAPPPLTPDQVDIAPVEAGEAKRELVQLRSEQFAPGAIAWAIVGAAAVFLLVGFGLTCFYCGALGVEDPPRVMIAWLGWCAVLSLVWILWGYSLSFERNVKSFGVSEGEVLAPSAERFDGNPILGGTRHVGMSGLESRMGTKHPSHPLRRPGSPIPHGLFMALQMMFFLAAPAPLIVLLAGRLSALGVGAFLLLWSTLVYAPLTYWTAGGGWMGAALDGNGGLVAHVAVGFSALVVGWISRSTTPRLPETHSATQTLWMAAGAGMFWAGSLFGNAAQAPAANGYAANAMMTAHLAMATGLIGWAGWEWLTRGATAPLGRVAGVIAGAAAIAAGSRFMAPQSAIITGVLSAAAASAIFVGVRRQNPPSGPELIFSLQGIPGALGVLFAGVFTTSAVAGLSLEGKPLNGLLAGNLEQLVLQAKVLGAAVLVAMIGGAVSYGIARGVSIALPKIMTGVEKKQADAVD